MSKVDPLKIYLLSVKILKAHFEVGEELMDQSVEIGDYNVDLGSNIGFNLEDKLVRFRLNIFLSAKDKEGLDIDIKGRYCIDFTFHIENLQEFIHANEEEESFSVDDSLAATIAGISYSTSRGIILDRTQATDFNGVLLPVIDPYSLLEQEVKA